MWVVLAYVLAFVAVVMVVQGAATVIFSSGDRTRRVNRRLDLLQSGMSRDDVFQTLVKRRPQNALADAAPSLYERFTNYFRQAGLIITPQRFLIILGIVMGVVLVIGFVALSIARQGGGLLINFLVATFGAVALVFLGGMVWLSIMRNRRMRRMEEQLPMALDVMVRALRAGHPLMMSVKLASEEMKDPIGTELGLIVDEVNYGMEFRDALTSFAKRTASEYAHFFAVCVSIQNETGGNLAEILDNLSQVIRAMQSLHLKVRALAAEGKMSAQVLTALPIFVVSVIMFMQPGFYTSKMDDPIFWPAAAVVCTMFLIGQFMINRMVNFKY
jgi:tight adherence protein B